MKFGVFDSGIGGVTVLQALRKQFPGARFAYFGDTAHVPYGTKSAAQIRVLSESAARRIRDHGVDALVVACNTASSWALAEIEAVMGELPVYGMVEAGVRAVETAARTTAGPIVVFGTRATVRSGIYGRELRAILPEREVFEQACPLLVPLIEEGWVSHPVLELTLREYVAPYLPKAGDLAPIAPGVALLACTHYPWIHAAFEKVLPGWKVIDSADAVVARLQGEKTANLGKGATPVDTPVAAGQSNAVEWFFSDPEVAQFIFADFSEDGAAPVIRTF